MNRDEAEKVLEEYVAARLSRGYGAISQEAMIAAREAVLAAMTRGEATPEYSEAVGHAGDSYIKSVSLDGRYHLSAMFRWHELWDAMRRAAANAAPLPEPPAESKAKRTRFRRNPLRACVCDVVLGRRVVDAICFFSWDSGVIYMTQGQDEILINPESVPELCKILKKLAEAKS